MAYDENGNGLAYVGDAYGVSLYQAKYSNLDIFQLGVRQDDPEHKLMIRKNDKDEWLVTGAQVPVRDDGRTSGEYVHVFLAANVTKIIMDLYVAPQLVANVQIPDTLEGLEG
jgi:hypothetical protein